MNNGGSAEFEGRVAVVTGGTSGIGLATARRLARAGARVVVAGRSASRGEEVLRTLEGEGTVSFIAADVARAEDVTRLFSSAEERWGRVDLAVHAAAVADMTLAPTAELTEAEFDRVLAVDLKGAFLCLKAALQAMLRSGGGAIVNVSSVNGLSGTPHAAHYCAAKHGLHGLTRTAALEYAAKNIRVNAVSPGAHRTPMLERMFDALAPGKPDAAQAMYEARIPLRRLGDPDECAQAICWLLSPAASYVTGALLNVDGGLAAGG